MTNTFKNTKVVYLGFNNMLKHKRGVENVIDFQSKASGSHLNYYIHWDHTTSIYKYKGFLCIGIKANMFKFLVLNWFLIKIKKREKVIFIHSHNTLMSMACVFQTHLFTVHDALYYQQKAIKHKFSTIFYLLELFLYTRVKYVHFISNYAKKMSLFSRKDNFVIIHNTSHLESYSSLHVADKEIKHKQMFKQSAVKVFTVRSIEERSRIDLLIKVAKELKDSYFEFFIAGKGPLYDSYHKKIKEVNLNNIQLLGYVTDDDIIYYYKECDIVLMPAEYAEGFGLPIIEGYLFNKPVIASNKCAIPDVIISNEFLFENRVESIVEKLDFAKKKTFGLYQEYYKNNFSNRLIFNQFNGLYNKLM